MRFRISKFLLILFCSFFAFTTANAQMVVEVTEGNKANFKIAIADFAGPNGANIARVIREDLDRSGKFEIQNPASFPADKIDINLTPKFALWREAKTEGLVIGRGISNNNTLKVEFRLWQTFGETQTLGLEFSSSDVNWRRIAHKISDAILQKLTGNGAMFDSRVVFVAESGPKTKRIKRLAIMDQDGADPSFLTNGDDQILNPRFSKSGNQIVYTAMNNNGLKIWVLDIATGRKEAISGAGNMVFAPRFSPDGHSVIFSSDTDGNADIFIKNLKTSELRQITNHPSIDTSPDLSPDNNRIVFTSDRSGSPQIYKMNIDGTGTQRVSFASGSYSTPVWSPDGSMIAFTKQLGGKFHIGVMNANGTGERILSSAYLVEGPSFAPNGKAIVFQREAGPGDEPSLWTIDLNGSNLRRLSFNNSGSDPAWSPILQ